MNKTRSKRLSRLEAKEKPIGRVFEILLGDPDPEGYDPEIDILLPIQHMGDYTGENDNTAEGVTI